MNTKEIAEIDLGSLLQFDLLKKVINHFLKEQKSLIQKVASIEIRVKKDNSQTNKVIASLQTQINQLSTRTIKEEGQGGDKPELESKPIQDNSDNSNIMPSSLTPTNKIETSKSNNNIINDDNLLSEIEDISMNMNSKEASPKKDSHQSYTIDQNPLIEEIDKKVNELTDVVNEMNVKMSEFNIYNAFKSSENDQGEGKVGIDVVLIKALESKVFTKFSQLEEKLKLSDQSLVKLKVDLSNTANKSDSAYRTAFLQKDQLEKYISDNSKALEDMDTKFSSLTKESNDDMSKLIQQTREDLLKSIDEKSSLKSIPVIKTSKTKEISSAPTIPQEVLNEMQNELKLMINKSISESEKYVKGLISELAMDVIRKDIAILQKGIASKLEKKDLQDIFLKFDDFNSVILGMKDEMENITTNNKNNGQSIEKLAKRAEFLTNLIYTKQPVNNDSSSSNSKVPAIDFTKYATLMQLNQFQSSLQSDIDKLGLRSDELKKLIELNDDQHKFFPSEKDLRNMEQCIMNEMDEYKLNAMKKFSDKLEVQKSFRFLDLQIKHLSGNYNKKDREANNDNWLLAKKPIGMYQCASCESVIGDLSAKSDYIPWNRIQNREDAKKYRVRPLMYYQCYN